MPAVGPTALPPGEETTLLVDQHPVTEPHVFEIAVESNDATPGEKIYLTLDYPRAK